jgi:tape measure domain-containing protein
MNGVVSEMLIRIAADTAQLRSEMNEAKRAVGDGFDDMKAAGASLRTSLIGIFAAIGVGQLAKQFVEVADAMSQMNARLKLATSSSQEFRQAQADIYRISQQNSIGLEEVASLYTKLNDPVKRLGGSAKETSAIVESFSLSLKVGGASAQEASAATLQFAQAMGSGKLQGDEFRSMAEASPRFMKALADGMGVPVEKLKEMGSEGKLTADVVGNALMKALGDLRRESESLPDTVSGAFTRIKNDVFVAVGELNENSGLTLGIAGLVEYARTDLLPVIKDELAGAFAAVADWIGRNEEMLGFVWSQAKGVLGEAWEIAKTIGGWIGFLVEALRLGELLGAFLLGVRVTVAGVKDGVTLIAAGFAQMGSLILQMVLSPLQLVLQTSAMIAGVFDKDLAEKIRGVSATVDQFASAGSNYAKGVVADFAAGKSSVMALANELVGATGKTNESTEAQKKHGDAANGAATSFGTLKSKISDNSEEQKKAAKEAEKAKAEYDKLIKSISDKTGLLIAETQQTEKLTDGQKTALKVMQDIQAGTLKLTDEQKRNLATALEQYLQQEKSNNATKEANDLSKKRAEELKKTTDAQIAEASKLIEGNRALEEQNLKLKIGDAAFRDRQIALLKTRADELEWQAALDDGNAALIAQAKALRERAGLLEEGGVLEAAKKTADEWQKTADSIQEGLTDSLFRAAENGKGFFQSLKDGIKGMFNNLVLKPIINAVMKPIAGGISSLLSGGASAAGGGGGDGGLGGIGSLLSSAGSLFGAGGLSGSLMAGAGWLTGATSFTGALSAAGSLMGTGTLGGMMSGLGMAAGALGPIALGVMAVMSLMKKGGGPKSGGQSIMELTGGISSISALQSMRVSDGGRYIYTPDSDDARVSPVTRAAVSAIQDMSQLFGIATANMTLGIGYDTDPRGKAPTRISSFARVGSEQGEGSWLSWNREIDPAKLQEELADEMQRVIIQGLMYSDLPESIAEIFSDINPVDSSIDEIKVALEAAQALGMSVKQFGDAVRMMPFENLKGLSFDAAAGLVKLAGGIENLLNQLQTYYQNFYSATEQAGIAAQQSLKLLESVGISSSNVETRQEFRALFESLNANTEQGREQIAAMLQVAGSMASVFSFLEQQGKETGIESIQELVANSPQVTVLETMLTPAAATAASTAAIADSSDRSAKSLEKIESAVVEQNASSKDVYGQMVEAVGLMQSATQTMVQAGSAIVSASNQLATAAGRLSDSVALMESQPTYSNDIGAA